MEKRTQASEHENQTEWVGHDAFGCHDNGGTQRVVWGKYWHYYNIGVSRSESDGRVAYRRWRPRQHSLKFANIGYPECKTLVAKKNIQHFILGYKKIHGQRRRLGGTLLTALDSGHCHTVLMDTAQLHLGHQDNISVSCSRCQVVGSGCVGCAEPRWVLSTRWLKRTSAGEVDERGCKMQVAVRSELAAGRGVALQERNIADGNPSVTLTGAAKRMPERKRRQQQQPQQKAWTRTMLYTKTGVPVYAIFQRKMSPPNLIDLFTCVAGNSFPMCRQGYMYTFKPGGSLCQ